MKTALAWQIGSDKIPSRLSPGTIALEKHLEDWIDADPAIVADDLIIIGRQVRTAWGTSLDLLGLDDAGNLVIIELKRDQSLRETVAQALEYAAWASKLGYEEVLQIATLRFNSREKVADAFEERLGIPFPETLNGLQRVLVVAPTIDDTTSFVIEYLSETYRVPINAVSFDVFGESGDQILVRHFAIEESLSPPPPLSAKSRPTETWEDALARAREMGCEDLVVPFKELADLFPKDASFIKTGWTYYAPTAEEPSGVSAFRVIFRSGWVSVTLRANNLSAVFGHTVAAAQGFIDAEAGPAPKILGRGFTRLDFEDSEAATDFAARFRAFLEKPGTVADSGEELAGSNAADPLAGAPS